MYFPAQLAPNKILGRFPVTPSTVKDLKGITNSGIVISSNGTSPSKKQRQFYIDILTDRDGQLQSKVPAVLEVITLPEKYDNQELLNLQVGDFWAVDSIAGSDFGIDVEIDSEGNETYFWYILFGSPKNLVWKVKEADVKEIVANYNEEDIFLQDASESLTDEMMKASKPIADQSTLRPNAVLKSPILDIGNKIHTM